MVSGSSRLERAMDNAESYEEWSEAAQAYDRLQGFDRWKAMDQSRRYDYRAIRFRLEQLRDLRARGDDQGLLFTLNEGIHGNMAGMGNARLFSKARFGTKQLVVDYVDEIVSALEHLAGDTTSDITFAEKLDFFRRASHCFGRTALMMSGAGSLLYFHVGVIKALWQEGLLPKILSGSSGGAIVSAIVGTHTEEELDQIFDPAYLMAEIKQERGLWKNLSSVRRRRIPIEEIKKILERLLPDLTFQEAAERTGRQINISVAPYEPHQTSRLLNAITSPNVYVHEACLASAAVPGVYPPVVLAAKNVRGERQPYLPSRQWVDGSVSDDLPVKRLARLYGVNHYIASQTNPLVLPFVVDPMKSTGNLAVVRDATQKIAKEWIKAGAALVNNSMGHISSVGSFIDKTASVVNQKYVSDINILPDTKLFNPLKLLGLRTEQEVMDMIRAGERATWPKLEMVRVQTRISPVLDAILEDYEQRMVARVADKKPARRRRTKKKKVSAAPRRTRRAKSA